jgi:hypothetical protein
MGKIRLQDIEILDEERPSPKEDHPKKRGRIQHEEREFPTKKPDTWIGRNRKDSSRR